MLSTKTPELFYIEAVVTLLLWNPPCKPRKAADGGPPNGRPSTTVHESHQTGCSPTISWMRRVTSGVSPKPEASFPK